jgi:hypothetical protein
MAPHRAEISGVIARLNIVENYSAVTKSLLPLDFLIAVGVQPSLGKRNEVTGSNLTTVIRIAFC